GHGPQGDRGDARRGVRISDQAVRARRRATVDQPSGRCSAAAARPSCRSALPDAASPTTSRAQAEGSRTATYRAGAGGVADARGCGETARYPPRDTLEKAKAMGIGTAAPHILTGSDFFAVLG